MADTQSPPALPTLIEISKLDVQIALLSAQKKKLEGELAARKQVIVAHETKRNARAKVLAEKKLLCDREEKGTKHERDRINERRAALNTLNNYKLQQAAEREIDFVAKQIGQREDLLLGLMREIETMEKDLVDTESVIKGLQDELSALEKESTEAIQGIDSQLQTLNGERAAQAGILAGQKCLVEYNRIKDRFPSNPIVEVLNRDSCAGCFMKLGPQVGVLVSRGDVVKCPGCGRMLRLAAE
jgi:predicted  nucleic acid-binding Zn-ribbon protein